MVKTAACILASLGLYMAAFGLLVHKPISVGVVHDLYRSKIAYAGQIDRPKLVVAAGSSGLYGVRCELIERNTGLPCVNMSTNLQMGMIGILEFARRALRPGDVVLLPLEYGVYAAGGYGSMLRQCAVGYDADLLLKLPPERLVWSIFYFDLKWLFAALSESWAYYENGDRMALQEPGALTRQGDLRGHVPSRGKRFAEDVRHQTPDSIYLREVEPDSEAMPILRDFLAWANARDIRVVGALPPTVDTAALDEERLQIIRDAYISAGHDFIDIENRGLYPIECFYDSTQHLNEPCQAAHTRALTRALLARVPLPEPAARLQSSQPRGPANMQRAGY